MCSKNISLFLKACEESFNLPTKQLFTENDLWNLEDFGRVLRVVSLFSYSHQAKQFPQLHPFPVPSPASPSSRARQSLEEDDTIYCNLREEVEEIAASTAPPPSSRRRELRQMSAINSADFAPAECHYDFIIGNQQQNERKRRGCSTPSSHSGRRAVPRDCCRR